MSKDRRYQDHEVRQILDLAIGQEESPSQPLPAVDGMSLVELQEVAREVGIERVIPAVISVIGGDGSCAARVDGRLKGIVIADPGQR